MHCPDLMLGMTQVISQHSNSIQAQLFTSSSFYQIGLMTLAMEMAHRDL